MKLKTTKIIIMEGGSLYIGANTYDLEKHFTYNAVLDAYVDNCFFEDMSVLIYSEFDIQYHDEGYDDILKKVMEGFD